MANSSENGGTNEELKAKLYKELEFKLDLTVHGINVDTETSGILGPATSGQRGQERQFVFTDGEFLGTSFGVRPDRNSAYGLETNDGKTGLYRYGKNKTLIGDVELKKRAPRPEILNRLTSDGVPFHTIASIGEDGRVHVNYSQQCVLKDKGEDCYFCNYGIRNATIKTPKQVGEVFSELYLAGVGKHLNLTSGFMQERRELEYYLDVGEEIRNRTGLKEFRATAVIGAPVDLSQIEKYKEAGFFSIRMNIEIWDKNVWKAFCPGKHNHCGGWDNWVDALERAVEVFGRAKVASNIVGGLESKKTILEGVEYKLSRGILASAGSFHPMIDSYLEGHRTPETGWHFDLQKKIAALYKKHGYTFEQLHNVSPSGGLAVSIFQIENEDFEDGKLRPWRYPEPKVGIIA
jgi:hypothetical protein